MRCIDNNRGCHTVDLVILSQVMVATENADAHNGEILKELLVLLRRAGEQMRQLIGEAIEGAELTPSQFVFLASIERPAPMGTLAEHLCLDASYVTGVVDHLEDRGLVERRADPSDRRRTLVAVTEDGRRMRRRIHEEVSAQAPLTTRLDPREMAELTALLRKAVAP